LNDIQPVLTDGPHWKKGDVFLSLRALSMVMLFRPSTNKIIWKGVGHTAGQHDVDILDNHRISIFNNNSYLFNGKRRVDGNSEVVVYNFDTGLYSKYLEKPLINFDVRTKNQGLSEILTNGDLFIEEQNFGRLLYFNQDGSIKWQYVNRANNGNLYLLNWSRILFKPKDLIKVRKIIQIEEKNG
jgi:outer membrane protein assembly factor BamB